MAKTLYLIDGHSMIYRAYYAPFRQLTSPTGEPTRATYVFSQQLITFIAKRKPEYLAMAVDGPTTKLHRKAVYADYKLTRKPMPSDLPPQVERIREIVAAAGIPILECEGTEADDILATAVEKFASADLNVVLISRDKDLDQVIGPHTVLYDPMDDRTLDADGLVAAKGYPPQKAVEIQTLCGDDTDNIPGIPGVGAKTAAKLIEKYGSADAVVAHADELTPKLKEAVLAHAAMIPIARQLVTLDRHAAIQLDLGAMEFAGIRGPAVRALFSQLGFNRLLDQLDKMDIEIGGRPAAEAKAPAAAGGEKSAPAKPAAPRPAGGQGMLFESPLAPTTKANVPVPPPPESCETMTTAKDFEYRCIDTSAKLDEVIASLRDVKRLAIDTETTAIHPMWADLVGISLAWQAGKAVYLPVRGPMGCRPLDLDEIRAKLGPILADPSVEKIGQHVKYDLIVLQNAGFTIAGPLCDTMIAAHVLDSTRASFGLDALAAEYLGHRSIPIVDLIGRGKKQTTMDAVPLEDITAYACEDADLTLRLACVLEKDLAAEGMSELLYRLEMPLCRVLAEMERTGVTVHPQALRGLETEMSKQADVLRDKVIARCGGNINPDSPRQLAEVLFERLKLPVLKTTPTGPSTDMSVLEDLAPLHELPAMVLEYRKLTKLLGTYLVALRQCMHPRTGRVHTSFHQAATVTGRLSSSDPNLQNIPIRTEQGRQIRSAFVAADGFKLISADYSQVELRVLAHFCQDPVLIRAFEQDHDIHRIVAAEVFGVPLDQVTPQQRSRAKTVNFGIIYGQTAFGLARTLRIPRGEAGEFIKAYRQRFPRIDEFLRACIEQAKTHGYVQTIFGRRRRISGLHSGNPGERSAAERLAINSVVQGSAADLIKQAMINIAARIETQKRPSRMLLQIHDELVFETPEADVEAEKEMIVAEMSSAIKLSVPLKVEVGVGSNWMDAK